MSTTNSNPKHIGIITSNNNPHSNQSINNKHKTR